MVPLRQGTGIEQNTSATLFRSELRIRRDPLCRRNVGDVEPDRIVRSLAEGVLAVHLNGGAWGQWVHDTSAKLLTGKVEGETTAVVPEVSRIVLFFHLPKGRKIVRCQGTVVYVFRPLLPISTRKLRSCRREHPHVGIVALSWTSKPKNVTSRFGAFELSSMTCSPGGKSLSIHRSSPPGRFVYDRSRVVLYGS